MSGSVKITWSILAVVAVGVGIFASAPYFTLDPAKSRVELNPSFSLHYSFLAAHIILALTALIAGMFQFIERVRIRSPQLHRAAGRVYVVCVFLSGSLGLIISVYIESFTKVTAFLTLSLLWLFTSWKGYRTAVLRRFQDHRVWMLRSYAITLVAVTARLIVPVCILLYLSLHGFRLPGGREAMVEAILETNIWIGLAINLVLVEWIVVKRWKG